jgi:hypothetical protein
MLGELSYLIPEMQIGNIQITEQPGKELGINDGKIKPF